MARAGGGFHPISGSGASSFGRRRSELPLDEARLRPHLRKVQEPVIFIQPDNLEVVSSVLSVGAPSAGRRSASEREFRFPMPQDVRGIPVVGPGVGGVQPGTNPERATIAKLSRERAA